MARQISHKIETYQLEGLIEEGMIVLSRWCILYYHMDYSNLT